MFLLLGSLVRTKKLCKFHIPKACLYSLWFFFGSKPFLGGKTSLRCTENRAARLSGGVWTLPSLTERRLGKGFPSPESNKNARREHLVGRIFFVFFEKTFESWEKSLLSSE